MRSPPFPSGTHNFLISRPGNEWSHLPVVEIRELPLTPRREFVARHTTDLRFRLNRTMIFLSDIICENWRKRKREISKRARLDLLK